MNKIRINVEILFAVLVLSSCNFLSDNTDKKVHPGLAQDLLSNTLSRESESIGESGVEWEEDYEKMREKYEHIYHVKYFREFMTRITTDSSTMRLRPESFVDTTLVYVLDSDDKRIRVYTWDAVNGGNSHSWHNAIQYRRNGKVVTMNFLFEDLVVPETLEDNYGVLMTSISAVTTDRGDKIYLARSRSCGLDYYTNVEAWTFENGILRRTFRFERDGEFHSDITVHYGDQDRPLYCPDRKRLYLSTYFEKSDLWGFEVYRFDGDSFHYQGIYDGEELDEQLQDFDYCVEQFETETYRIRIDKMFDGRYRYASWKNQALNSDLPDLVLYTDEVDAKNKEYVFKAGGSYSYQIMMDGETGHLCVKQHGKVLLRE